MDKTSSASAGTEEAACDKEQHSMSMDRAIGLIGDRWTLFIVYNLLSGPKRFGELLTMGNVSPKTVSQRLKMLEKIGFVERHAFAEIPPRVEYHLTEKGQALVDILQAISQFGERYLADDEILPPPARAYKSRPYIIWCGFRGGVAVFGRDQSGPYVMIHWS